MNRIILLFLIPLFLLSENIKPRHILLLNSYNQSMEWVQDVTKAVYDVLEPSSNNLVIHIENMDTKRIYTPKHLAQLKKTYKNKYKDVSFDLILSSDNNAFDFLKQNKKELFGDVPVVFSGLNFFKDSDLVGYENYTGATEEFDALGTLNIAMKLKPNTKEVFIINDFLKTGIAWKKAIHEQLGKFDKSIKITYSKNTSVEELGKVLNSLSKDTIVLLGAYFKDNEGRYLTYSKMGEILTRYSKVPVFTLLEFYLNKGVVGGKVIGGYYQGESMSKIAKKLLNGVSISALPVQKTGSTKTIFDYKELEKYNMDIKILPKNTLIINKPSDKVTLTKEEKHYLKQKKKIKLCIDPDWMPFEKLDNNGQHIGLSRDYINLFQDNIGIPINIVKTRSWSESLEFAKNRKCDILSLAMPTAKRMEYMDFTSPYISLALVLATKLDVAFIEKLEQLNNKKIAIVKEYAFSEILKNKYPNIIIHNAKNIKEGLQMVSNGEVFGLIGSIADIGYVSQKSFFGEIKIAGKFDEKWNLSIAVRNDEKLLLEIFEKSIQNLSADIKQKILNKHIAISYEKGLDYTILWQVLLGGFIIFIAFIYRHIVLKKANSKLALAIEDKTKELRQMNEDLEEKIQVRTHLLSLKAHRITYLLDNASQGFLSFDKDFLVDYEYSVACEKLLGKELQGKDITRLLFGDKTDKVELFKETMIDAFTAKSELTASLILSLLPKELVVNKRALQLEYKLLSNNKFMLILTNITDKKKLQTKIKKEQSILKMIVSIVSDSVLFFETKENFEIFCRDINLYIDASKTGIENSNTLYILIHTFKGLFAQLYMKDVVKKLHTFEAILTEFSDNNNGSNQELEKIIEISMINGFLKNDLKTICATLGESFIKEQSYIKINEEEITQIEKKVLKVVPISASKNIYGEILYDIKKLKNKSLKHYLSMYPKLCQQLCLSLNKSILPFEIEGEDDILVSDHYKPFLNSLIHVFRNSCDHGIETKEERISQNKDEVGKVNCILKSDENSLIIIISDDGSGIDINLIKEKIIQKGILTKNTVDTLSQNEILQYIFDPHFSTNDLVSEVSGRGIGLAAVKDEMDKLNAKVEVKTEFCVGTSFIFSLPVICNDEKFGQ